jgi:hypothetical protein
VTAIGPRSRGRHSRARKADGKEVDATDTANTGRLGSTAEAAWLPALRIGIYCAIAVHEK